MAPNFLSVTWCAEAFNGLYVQDVKSLILVVFLFLLDRRRKEERKKGKKSPWGRRVSLGLNLPCWLCSRLQLLGAITG
jgi:hypothetical protein